MNTTAPIALQHSIYDANLHPRLKRLLDVTLSTALLMTVLPLMFMVAVGIKLDSPGSVFYVHQRVGQRGRRIRIYKFRSMVAHADCILESYLRSHPAARREWALRQKLRDDPRITSVGRYLRRYSIDELPQLVNVIKGDLSLVGPRPIVASEARRYGQRSDVYGGIRPGVTGLWQVSGRNDTSYAERVRLDAYYVQHWSVWLDFRILLRTLGAMLSRSGAY